MSSRFRAKLAVFVALLATIGPAMADPQTRATAIFAGGCFWCMEPSFDKVDGVISTTSGYTGGSKVDPSYNEVSSGRTGHYEALQVEYDPARVTFQRLLEVFWRNIDPLDANGQFCDKGAQYRSAIFVSDDKQRALAEASRAELERSGEVFRTRRDRNTSCDHVLSRRG